MLALALMPPPKNENDQEIFERTHPEAENPINTGCQDRKSRSNLNFCFHTSQPVKIPVKIRKFTFFYASRISKQKNTHAPVKIAVKNSRFTHVYASRIAKTEKTHMHP